jgi:translation elongation factor EF-Tu-like GTPase
MIDRTSSDYWKLGYMARPPDIEVEITFLPTAAGGRQGYVGTGYRGQFYYDGTDWDAEQTFVGRDRVDPGGTITATVVFTRPEAHEGKLSVGTVFLIREGLKTVGYGKVTRILNLADHAAETRAQARM